MTTDLKTGLIGLVTNAGRLSAPPGSLEVADNVVIRKRGVVEPRPGISDLTLGWTPPSSTVRKLWEYDGKPHAYASNGGFYQVYSSTKRQITHYDGAAADPVVFRADLLPVCKARGNCYVGSEAGIIKLTGSTDTTFGDVGVIASLSIAPVLTSSGSPVVLANNTQVGYRAVIKRSYPNGLVARSAPCGAVYAVNSSGGVRDVQVGIITPDPSQSYGSKLLSIDEVEIYRTRVFSLSGTVDEEYALVATIAYASFANGFAYVTDTLLDSERGAALYTSPSQGGATAENARPPSAGCMALFKGHLVVGNTCGPFRKTVSADITRTSLTGSSTGIGFRYVTGTTVGGSAVITALSSTTGIQAGMIVEHWAFGTTYGFPSGTYVVSVDSATQVTVSNVSSYPAVGANLTFLDAVKLGGSWFPVFTTRAEEAGIAGLELSAFAPFVPGVSAMSRWTGDNLATCSTAYYARNVTPPVPGYTHTFIFEELERSSQSASTPTIRATHGNEYYPPLALYSGTATDMERDAFQNGVAWSKRDEPEHFSPVSYALVGDSKAAILGMASTRDALFILKEDGIWRMSGPGGNTANAWRIDPFDMTTFCVLPQSVQQMNGRVYFLSNKGVVRLSDAGVEVISSPVGDEVRRMVQSAQTSFNTSGYYYVGTPSWSSAANEVDGEYMITTGGACRSLTGALVFNETTGAWTTWSLSLDGAWSFGTRHPSALAWSSAERAVLLGDANVSGWVRKFTPYGTDSPIISGLDARDDGYLAVTISSVTGSSNSYVVTYSAAKLLRVGDVVVDSAGISFVVTDVTSSTVVTVTGRVNGTTYTAPVTGAGFVAAVVASTVRARPFTAPSVVDKQWGAIKAGFSEINGCTSVKVTSLSNVQGASASSSAQVSERVVVPYYRGRAAAWRGMDAKMNVPRAQARSRDLWPGAEVQCAMGNWQLESFSVIQQAGDPGKLPTSNTGAA